MPGRFNDATRIADLAAQVAALTAQVNGLTSSPTKYVSSTIMTVDQLHTAYPPSLAVKGMYARVSDLFVDIDDIMRCRWDGVAYKWVPQREAFSGITTATSGTVPITPLVTPPTLRVNTTNLTGNLNFTPSSTRAYIGQRNRIIMSGALNLAAFTAQVTGLIGSNITLLAGSKVEIEYGSTGFFQIA